MDNKKSHKRQFIEKWITPNDYNSQIEKELLEAIEKDRDFNWTNELVGKFAEIYRFSSSRTSMKQFKQMVTNPTTNDSEWIRVLKYEEPSEQFSREDMLHCALDWALISIDDSVFRTHFNEWLETYLNSPEYLKAKS